MAFPYNPIETQWWRIVGIPAYEEAASKDQLTQVQLRARQLFFFNKYSGHPNIKFIRPRSHGRLAKGFMTCEVMIPWPAEWEVGPLAKDRFTAFLNWFIWSCRRHVNWRRKPLAANPAPAGRAAGRNAQEQQANPSEQLSRNNLEQRERPLESPALKSTLANRTMSLDAQEQEVSPNGHLSTDKSGQKRRPLPNGRSVTNHSGQEQRPLESLAPKPTLANRTMSLDAQEQEASPNGQSSTDKSGQKRRPLRHLAPKPTLANRAMGSDARDEQGNPNGQPVTNLCFGAGAETARGTRRSTPGPGTPSRNSSSNSK